MRVSCPACDAAYDIPDQVLATGERRLRCARCAHEWIPVMPPAAPPPATVAEAKLPPITIPPPVLKSPVMQPPPELPEAPAKPRLVVAPKLTQDRHAQDKPERAAAARAVAGWVLTVVVLAGLSYAAWRFRDTVQAVWPPSRMVYAALGLG